MIRAIWSFWSKPYLMFHNNAWLTEKHHLLSWILSVESARKHYPDTWLYTDDVGATLLVDNLGIPFQHVTTKLNDLKFHDPAWWTLGKLYTYRSQTSCFVHIDSDVFLWKKLPRGVVNSQICAQNPERMIFGEGSYRPDLWEAAVRAIGGWTWYTRRQGNEAVCCGFLGGRNSEFLAYYADKAIRMVEHSHNLFSLQNLVEKVGSNILVEQYLLSACIYHHRLSSRSLFPDIQIRYLFESEEQTFMQEAAKKKGYTHLIAGAKRNSELMTRLERRVARDYPEYYEKVVLHLEKGSLLARNRA